MLGTGCPLANEVFVGAIQPLKAGEEKHSFTAMVPLNAKGLKILSRKSYEAEATSKCRRTAYPSPIRGKRPEPCRILLAEVLRFEAAAAREPLAFYPGSYGTFTRDHSGATVPPDGSLSDS